MARKRRPSSTGVALATELAELEQAFASYRRGRRVVGRIPEALRARVLAAVDAGVPAAALSRRCGVTTTQVTQWRRARSRSTVEAAGGTGPQVEAPVILEVLDEPAVERDEPIELELGVGSWRVSIRLQPAQARRTQG